MHLKVPPAVVDKSSKITADQETYGRLMTVVRTRLITIDRLLTGKIHIPQLVFRVESVYLQFRLVIETLYLTTIVSRRKKYTIDWPASEREYQPSVIRKYLRAQLTEHFPYPFRHRLATDGHQELEFFAAPISEEELYSFFNQCHQYLHEPNPYKRSWEQREVECPHLLNEAAEKARLLWQLLENHCRVSILENGDKAHFICRIHPDESGPVELAHLFAEH